MQPLGTRAHVLDTRVPCMHSHAHHPVPVTSFLGDSVQLDSHTSKSPESKQRREREAEEEREPLGRQAGRRSEASGCRARLGGRRRGKRGRGRE